MNLPIELYVDELGVISEIRTRRSVRYLPEVRRQGICTDPVRFARAVVVDIPKLRKKTFKDMHVFNYTSENGVVLPDKKVLQYLLSKIE